MAVAKEQSYLARNMFERSFLLIFILGMANSLEGQIGGELRVVSFDCHEDLPIWLPYAMNEDSLNLILEKWVFSMIQKGYLAASIDSMVQKDDSVHVYCYVGRRFYLTAVEADSVHLAPYMPSQDALQIQELDQWTPAFVLSLVRDKLGNQGYHQAEVNWSPRFTSDSSYVMLVQISKGSRLRYGKIIVKDDTWIHPSFLRAHLFWKEGEVLENISLKNIQRRMSSLPFMNIHSDPEWALEYDRANLILDIGKQKANIFDFILGVLPAADNQDRNLILSVYLNTVFYNQLKRGERLAVKFINTKPETQELNLELEVPYLFESPFGIMGGLQLYRDEASHLDLKYRIGTNFSTAGNWTIGVEWERFSSSVLNADTAFLLRNRQLPEDLDFVTQRLNMSLEWMNLDRVQGPRRGMHLAAHAGIGQKQISSNSTLISYEERGIHVDSLYDAVGRSQSQFTLGYDFRFYGPLGGRFGWMYRSRGGHLFNAGKSLENELHRVGGNELMRGFDEQFFLVNQYWIQTVEGRFFIGPSSFFSVFWDIGYLERNTFQTQYNGWVNGPGMGLNFQTDIGIFNISYAIGSGLGFVFDPSAGKIHFGYVSMF